MRCADDDDPLQKHRCASLCEADGSRVGIAEELEASYRELEERKRARLERVMKLWCERRTTTREMINREGHSASGALLLAFKAFQVRLYGFETKLDGVRTFVIVDLDVAKKQDRADQNILKRAKVRVDAFGKGKAK